ncbi:hypothetical protein [Methylocella sp.]|uniref:hypothetical protein n=1 Tax=Methylocella sp. TaxID=1978226 RepID=UPI003C241D68
MLQSKILVIYWGRDPQRALTRHWLALQGRGDVFFHVGLIPVAGGAQGRPGFSEHSCL